MIPSRGTADLIEATTQRRPLFDQLFLEAAPICKLPFDVQLSTFMEDRDATARIRDFIKPPPDHFAFRWRRCSREFLFFFGREAQYFHFEIGSEMGCCPGSSTNCHARKIVGYECAVVAPRVLRFQIEGNSVKSVFSNSFVQPNVEAAFDARYGS